MQPTYLVKVASQFSGTLFRFTISFKKRLKTETTRQTGPSFHYGKGSNKLQFFCPPPLFFFLLSCHKLQPPAGLLSSCAGSRLVAVKVDFISSQELQPSTASIRWHPRPEDSIAGPIGCHRTSNADRLTTKFHQLPTHHRTSDMENYHTSLVMGHLLINTVFSVATEIGSASMGGRRGWHLRI